MFAAQKRRPAVDRELRAVRFELPQSDFDLPIIPAIWALQRYEDFIKCR